MWLLDLKSMFIKKINFSYFSKYLCWVLKSTVSSLNLLFHIVIVTPYYYFPLLRLLVMLISQGVGEQEMTSCIEFEEPNKINGLEYFSSCQLCGNFLPNQLTNKNQRGMQFF